MVTLSSSADAAAVAALRARVHPDQFVTVAGTAHWLRTTPASAHLSTWKVEHDGALVGWAAASLEPWATDRRRAECNVLVDPNRRGEGLGSALWLAVEEHLGQIGATHVICRSRYDEASKRFCERRGFRLTSTSDTLAVDPRTLPPAPAPPDDVEVRACAGFAADPTPFYEADFAAMQDEPGEH